MKNRCFFFISLIMLTMIQNLDAAWGIKLGYNHSYLKEPSYGKPGSDIHFGIYKDWRLYRSIHLRTGIQISNSSTLLKNRTVQSGSDIGSVIDSFPHLPDEGTGYTDIRYYDIDIHVRYLELPILFIAEKSIRNNFNLGFEIGCCLKVFPKDASKSTCLRVVQSSELTDDERQSFLFDYIVTNNSQNYSYGGGGLCPAIGMYVDYSKFQAGFRYQVDYIDWVSGIVIGEHVPLRIWSFSIGYRL